MSRVRIVTDSTADLSEEIIKDLQIEVVPLKVIFGEEVYRDWIDLKPKEFYDKLKASTILPTTSQPSPGEFAEVYQNIGKDGTSIISIHISSELSGTYQSAFLAKNMIENIDIEVIDTKLVAMALGIIVIEAARAAKEGKSKEEILALIDNLKSKIKLIFIVDTLEYLQKGGRIGKASALLGSILNIKPICILSEGIVTPYSKMRGKTKAIEKLMDFMHEDIKENQPIICSFIHCDDYDSVLQLKEIIEKRFNVKDSSVTDVGAVIGTHVGPGTVGVIFYPFL